MPLYRDYLHATKVAESLTPKLTVEGCSNLEKAIRHTHYINDPKEKRFFLSAKILESLWDIEEAVKIGFHTYIESYVKEHDDRIAYSKANPEE